MGYAYLPNGERIDYKQYIESHPHWQTVRQARFKFDGGMCAVCHKDLRNEKYETHHLSYIHLGNERMTDVITLCPKHHKIFHNNWSKQTYWKGRESGHWDVFDLEQTAILCRDYYREDKFICKDADAPNLCNPNTSKEYIDRYFQDAQLTKHPVIDPHDFELFVRNKRYELVFDAEARGLTVEEFLDECYGPKIRGKNPLRQEAGKKNGPFDHTFESFHRHYKENKNLLTLMDEVKRIGG